MKARWFVSLLVTFVVMLAGAGAAPAASAGTRLPDTGVTRSPHELAAGAYVTEVQKNHGWIQVYGKFRVRNLTHHKLHVKCAVVLFQGHHQIGSDVEDLTVGSGHTEGTKWSVEGGNEGGKISGGFHCHS